MKTGWQTKALGELCEIELGKTPARANKVFWDENRETTNVWLSIADLLNAKDNLAVDSKEYLSDKGAAISKIVRKGTLLVSFKLTLGRLAFAGRDLYTNEAIAALRLFNERELSREFLFYFLHFFDWRKAAENDVKLKGMTLNKAKLKGLHVHFPSLSEQQCIVGILDEAFDGIATTKANAEKNLQNTRALFESHLQAIFTQRGEEWTEKPLAELCDANRVITYGVIKLGDEVSGGVPCLRTSNVRWLRIETEGIKLIASSLSSEYSRTILKGGEVLVNVRGTLGGVAVVEPEMAGWNVSREVAVVPVDSSQVNPVFLSYLIGSGVSQQWLGGVKKGAAYVGINIEDLRLLPVSAPKLNKQLEVVMYLESLQEETQRLESIYRRKLAALDELKKSLLHQAFNGEL